MVGSRAYDMLNLDKVLFMPSKQPTYKNMDCIASEEDRCAMIERAIKPYPFFELSDYELKREGPTYSADTFSMLKKEHPDTKYYFIIGGDSLDYFEDWHLPDVILQNCTLVVAPRATELKEKKEAREFAECDYAATADRIRKKYTSKLADGSTFVPETRCSVSEVTLYSLYVISAGQYLIIGPKRVPGVRYTGKRTGT